MAKTISLKNISHAFLERTVLSGVSIKFAEGERICIVGENGTGKSTMLKIIAGTIEPTGGSIEKNTHIRTYYVAQEFAQADAELTVEAYITKYAGLSLFKKVYETSTKLGFNLQKVSDAIAGSLSGGQQKVLTLSVGIATAPDFLLLDEPENHLDIISRLELIKVLQTYKGGVLFVSHDRRMIDAVADKVVEVAMGKAHISEGGYQDYIDAKLARIGGMQRQYDVESKRIRQIQSTIGILESKAFRGKDVAKYLKTKQELAELKQKHKEESRPEDRQTKIKLRQNNNALHDGKLLCRVTDASFGYTKGHIFRDLTLDIRTGEHIVLLGRNGSGKSTFLKCLTGHLPLAGGTIAWTPEVTHAYFDQHAEFDPDMTPVEVVMEGLNKDEKSARAVLGMMKFIVEKMDTKIHSLSGGERMRVRFALVFGASPDFIILDEPTNHLDEVTWQILLDACNASKSTILLVTHDYEFIQDLKEKVFWLIKNQTIKERHKDLEEIVEELR